MKKSDMEKTKARKNEKGAAMVMVVLISFLLLVACAGVLLESSLNSANVTDAVAEQQAYYAAESGIQSALNVLRGNTTPVVASAGTASESWASALNPLNLIETRVSAADSTTANKIDFRKAVSPSTSNYANDPSATPRLSRWLTYSSPGNGAPDVVKVGSGNYGGFSLSISDPDKTGDIVRYRTDQYQHLSGLETRKVFYDKPAKKWKDAIKIVSSTNSSNYVEFSYAPNNILYPNSLDVSSGTGNTNFGSFTIKVTGTGINATDFPAGEDMRFQIVVDMLAPYSETRVIRGWIKKGAISSGSTVSLDFDSQDYDIMGSKIKLTSDPQSLTANNSGNAVSGTMSQAEPTRLIVKSTGYGPRGAKKQLETVVQKNFFNGLTAPAALTLIGSTSGFQFKPGNSTNVEYSGDDIASTLNIPSIGTTNDANLDTIIAELAAKSVKTVPNPPAENILTEVPFWLDSTKNLNKTVNDLKTVAKASGKYFTAGQAPNNFGDVSSATGITFVDGDVQFSGNGGGILVVTGKLTLHGNFSFSGLIIVTGVNGLERSGGGNGTLKGNTVVAPYDPTKLNDGFLSPKYDISGGGNSTLRYDSSSLANGMTAVSNFVLGVVEK